MSELFEKLSAYGESDYYPYHMPGHKRRLKTDTMRELAQIDITEEHTSELQSHQLSRMPSSA